jgi:hypothetical protein
VSVRRATLRPCPAPCTGTPTSPTRQAAPRRTPSGVGPSPHPGQQRCKGMVGLALCGRSHSPTPPLQPRLRSRLDLASISTRPRSEWRRAEWRRLHTRVNDDATHNNTVGIWYRTRAVISSTPPRPCPRPRLRSRLDLASISPRSRLRLVSGPPRPRLISTSPEWCPWHLRW